MPSEVLRFESSILHYGISSNEEPYSGQVGQLLVRELYGPTTDPELPSGIQDYQVIIEVTVSTREETWNAKFEAFELADELDRAWIYVCGMPLHPVYMQLQFLDSPIGWRTNAKEIEFRLAQAEAKPYVIRGSVKDWHWIRLPFFPLREALKVREALKAASEATLALIDLHYGALKSLDGDGKVFLLAKALEFCRGLVLGKNKNDKALEKSLPPNIRSALSQSVRWLFTMSHNRFEVRHAADPKSFRPHPRMTPDERATFTHDADLMIRAMVCQHISRPTFVVKQQ